MKKRKILIILGGFNFGGTVFSTLNMIMFLRKQYDVLVLPMNPCGPVCEKYEKAGVSILPPNLSLMAVSNGSISKGATPLRKSGLVFHKTLNHICMFFHINYTALIFKYAAKSVTMQYKPDYVCSSQEGITTEFASFFTQTKRIAWFRTEYSIWKDQLTPKRLAHNQKLYRKFDFIIPVSKTTADDFIQYFPDIADRVIPIHNIQKDDNISQRALDPIPDAFAKDTFNIVTVGRVAKQKQFYLIPGIAYKLKNEYGLNFKWYIIGDGDVDGERARFEAAFEQYNNRDYVIEMGSRINPYPYIASANLLVNTSYYEACPRVVAEAKILHTPVVCADFSSAREFVQNDYDGFVDSKEHLPKIIANLISDEALYQKIKANCNKYEMDNKKILKQLRELFS